MRVVVPLAGVLVAGTWRWAVVRDAPVAQHDRAVDQRCERAELVQDHHDGRPGVVQAADRLDERRLGRDVDAGRGLVENQEVWSANERARDQDALLLAAGHLLHRLVCAVDQADVDQRVERPLPVPVRAAERATVQEMSGGQQQRVLIARALVRRPDLLVLDEPTSGIDIPTQATFVETISRLHDAGTTVVVILHELGPFAPLIDRAVVLRHGRVAHDGPPPRARDEHAGQWHDHTHAHSDPPEPPSPLTVEVLP